MKRSSIYSGVKILFAVGLIATLFSGKATAQMANNPWGFQQQNRASVAALIRQVEREKNTNGTVTQLAAAPSYTSLVCGGGSQPSASGNTTCVILNNAEGRIDVGQDAQGNQTATANSTQNEVHPAISTDDVLATLNGNASP